MRRQRLFADQQAIGDVSGDGLSGDGRAANDLVAPSGSGSDAVSRAGVAAHND
ncbi:MAG: hypothetical protein ACPH26_08135 [Candidatus Puniceispirillaceae bacterium]|jgi:hypothetical protein